MVLFRCLLGSLVFLALTGGYILLLTSDVLQLVILD